MQGATTDGGKKTSAVRRHFNEIGRHILLFLRSCCDYRKPLNIVIFFNFILTLILAIAAMFRFLNTAPTDMIIFSDAAFLDSHVDSTTLDAGRLDAGARNDTGTAVFSAADIDTSERLCNGGRETCFSGYLHPTSSGMFAGQVLQQDSFNVPYMLWVAAWFVSPISVFLLANATWAVFEQWMWWGLFMMIMIWDVVGLVMMTLLNQHESPLYSKIMAFVYFLFSALLMFAVRETWKVLNDTSDVLNDRVGPMQSKRTGSLGRKKAAANSSSQASVVPKFMQVLMNGVTADKSDSDTANVEGGVPDEASHEADANRVFNPKRSSNHGSGGAPHTTGHHAYTSLAQKSDTVPSVVAHSFTRSVLILSELMFLAPVVCVSAYVIAQQRIVPFDVQARSWQTSLMFAIVVLLEKSRKTQVSYMSDTVLVMAALVSLNGVSWFAIPEFIWFMVGVKMDTGLLALYGCSALMYVTAVSNVITNFFCVTCIAKDESGPRLFEVRTTVAPIDPEVSGKRTLYDRVSGVMFAFNLLVLTTVKGVLMVTIVMAWV
jgi:hypothetical protein